MSDSPSSPRFVRGDATSPRAAGPKVIAHVCNDRGAWYRWRSGNDFALGTVRLVRVRPDVHVANMVAQHGVRPGSGGPPLRYEALAVCLGQLADHALELGATVHMPRIGCGLAGGRWDRVQPLIEEHLLDRGVRVTVYDVD